MADNDKIEKLWKQMAKDLEEKDPHDDWPYKGIVMVEPWYLEVHAYPEACEEHETQLEFFRQEAIRPEDFDESSLPPELLAIVKEEGEDDEWYPNHVSAAVSGATLEEAIEKMRLKLRLLDYGYILMDAPFYHEEILGEDNGAWLLDDDDDDGDDDDDDDDEIVIHLDDDDFKDDDDDAEDGDDRDD